MLAPSERRASPTTTRNLIRASRRSSRISRPSSSNPRASCPPSRGRGDHEDGRARPVDAVEELHDPRTDVRVEVPGGLVAHQRRVVRDGARSTRAAARRRTAHPDTSSPCARSRRAHRNRSPGLVAVLPTHLERVGDVLVRGAVGEQLEVEEHATLRRTSAPAVAGRARSRPPTMMRPRVGSLLDQQADDRRLAGAAGTDDEHELALVDDERDVAQRLTSGS